MLYCKKLAVLGLCLSVVAPLEARTRKGDRLLAQGRTAEIRKQYDQALDFYEQALSDDPADSAYQLAMRRARFQAGQFHVEQGLKLRANGKTAEALAEFEKAYAIDPASSIAEQEIRRTRAIIERDKKAALAPEGEQKPEERGLTPVEVARKESQERMDRVLGVPELKPLSNKPIDLRMTNVAPKTAFETLGKVAGINVVFDPDIPAGKNFNIEFNNETLETALDNLSVLTRFFWKPLSANTIFVTMDNTTKRRDYEEQVVKVFYLKNITTPAELNEISVNVRTVCAIQRLFAYPAQMALIVRAEADKVELAEKLIADLDRPKAEVIIDVLVLETNRSRDRDLQFGLTEGINSPITYNGTAASGDGAAAASAAIPLPRLQHLSTGQYSVVLPNASLQATMSDRNTRVMQSPQVRAAHNQKASLRIGDKVPTASGSFQPGIGGVGINPLVNTQFQYLEVGVNVDITPQVHGTDEVSLHVEMDVSQVRDHVDLGGMKPVIGQRKVTFDVRLREGEANVLGGLMQTQTGKTVSGIPGLAKIPLLGRLFSGESITNSESELLFVLIPHIVRVQDLTESNLKGIATGNDTVVKLSHSPSRSSTPTAAPAAAAPATSVATPAPAPTATTAPVTAPPVTAPPATAPPATAPPVPLFPATPAQPAAPTAVNPPGTARVTFAPARVEGQVGSAITVSMMVENATDLFTSPFRITFDQKIVRLNDVTPGGLLTSDGKQLIPPLKNILNDTGEASVVLTRVPGSGGVSGSGALVTFVFQAMARGTTTVSLSELSLRNSQLGQIPAASTQLTIDVR